MWDNVSFTISNFRKSDFDNLIENHIKNSPIKRVNRFQVDWHNLRINYFQNEEKIKISNSFHKWYSSEILAIGLVNHNDFNLSQVRESINHLERVLGRKSSEMKLLGRFEYGININTHSVKPFDIIDRYISSVTTATNPFYAFYNKYGKPYSKFCSLTNYNIKAYDKSKEAGITNSNIFRFEIVHHNSIKTRHIFGKDDITLGDLADVEIWNKCFHFLIKSYDSIRMLGFPENGTTNYAKMLCHGHPIIRRDYKNELKKIKSELKNTHDRNINSEDNPHSFIKSGLINNYKKLITN